MTELNNLEYVVMRITTNVRGTEYKFFSFIEFKQPKKNFFENSSTISNFFEGVESWKVSWLLIGLKDKMINQIVGQ